MKKIDLVMVHRHTKAGQSAAQFPGWLIPAFLLFHYLYSVTPETLELFRGYAWPGNLRELRNIIERSLVNARSGSPLSVSGPLGDSELGVPLTAARGERALDLRSAEEERLVETLIRFNGNKAKAARHLGISRGTVYKRLRELESRDKAS